MRILITLRQLEIFLAVARDGHVTKAAEALHLTQSATSMAIAQLERQLDTVLFERTGRRLKLTERGRLLMAEAPDLLSRVQDLPALLGGKAGALRGELRIAASTTIGRYLLAPGLVAFASSHPEVHVELSIGNTEAALDALKNHRADVAFVEGLVSSSDLVATFWRPDRLEVVVSASHAMAGKKTLKSTDLHKLQWILREPGSGTRQLFEGALRAAALKPIKPLLTLDDTEAVIQAISTGVAASCLSRLSVSEAVRTKRLVSLSAPILPLDRSLWRVTRRESRAGPLLVALDAHLSTAAFCRTSASAKILC